MTRTPAFVVIAFVALFALLVQPVCAAYHSPVHGQLSGTASSATADTGDGAEHGDPGACCASVQESMLVAPAAAVPSALQSDLAVLPTASSAPLWRSTRFSLPARAHPGTPPPPKSYYARSARILS